MVVVLTIDFYEEKLDYVRVCHVTSLRDPLSTLPFERILRRSLPPWQMQGC